MLSGGDELGRTQQGNNNAYCQDSPLSWTTWEPTGRHASLTAFVRRLLALRAGQPVLRRRTFLDGRQPHRTDVLWLRPDGNEMEHGDWTDPERRCLGMLLDGSGIPDVDAEGRRIVGDTLLAYFNAGPGAETLILPAHGTGAPWRLLVDTSLDFAPEVALSPGLRAPLEPHSAQIWVLTN
jgi:glycogen operon protein